MDRIAWARQGKLLGSRGKEGMGIDLGKWTTWRELEKEGGEFESSVHLDPRKGCGGKREEGELVWKPSCEQRSRGG